MDVIIKYINQYLPYIVILLAILILILLFMNFINSIRIKRLKKRMKMLLRGENGKSLEKVLKNYMDDVDVALSRMDDYKKQIDFALSKVELSINKVAIIRYNAFDEIGSDLSFSIAMLNDHDDGIVLTGIFGRNETTTYAKPIKNGTSTYKLSAEEIDVIEKARKGSIG